MRVVDAYAIRPNEIEAGDVMMFVIKAVVVRSGIYRLYRCLYEGNGVPQGSRMINETAVCEAVFPSLTQVAKPDNA